SPDFDFVFDYRRNRSHQVVDRAWIQIDAADDDHIVGPSQYPTSYASQRPPTVTRLGNQCNQIASAVPEHRHARPVQRSHHQLTASSLGNGFAGRRINHFEIKLQLVEMNRTRLCLAIEGPASDFRSAGMIEGRGAPDVFDALPDAVYACAR